ncbi:MAG: NAD-dependent epimerase/dehydratase family protein [Janthinobacterium lividum]
MSLPPPPGLFQKRVAVTGATGFISTALLHALHRAGAELVAIVGKGRRTAVLETLPFPVEFIEVAEVRHMGDAVREAAPAFVVHLSAHVSTERSYQSLAQTLEWNLLSTIDVLTACAQIGVNRVILMGSTEEYGQNAAPFDPHLALDPPSPYAASKAAQTAYARMFHNTFGLETVILRPTVVYGPGQSPRMLISMVMEALAAGRQIDVTEGKQTRDFVYVDDVVDAILLGLVTPGLEGDVWNIGSGEVVTVRDCLERIERITGTEGLVLYGVRPYISREIFRYESELEGTFAALNWRPAVTLDTGLQRTWEAIRRKVLAPCS